MLPNLKCSALLRLRLKCSDVLSMNFEGKILIKTWRVSLKVGICISKQLTWLMFVKSTDIYQDIPDFKLWVLTNKYHEGKSCSFPWSFFFFFKKCFFANNSDRNKLFSCLIILCILKRRERGEIISSYVSGDLTDL